MNSDPSSQNDLGSVKLRKPSTALNLSLFLPGLGQIYCGALGRGLLHLASLAALLVFTIVFLATKSAPPLTLLVTVVILALIPTAYSAWDARKIALSSREDYRLKDCNRLSVYLSLTFLMMSLATGLAFSVRENFLHLFTMAGSSMSPTLNEGDKILVRKDSYRDKSPARNELVAFLNPGNRRQTWVKRVIALPGDTVEIKEGIVHINGEVLQEVSTVNPDQANIPPITIPEHHCFLLGDNRVKSRDSRHIGPLPMIALVGKVVYVR
ncbi:MAG: signal peptidase I [Akkermansiaceae bacterium]|nr:signal peptidase I [Akkermansiaceae bacterium]